MVSFVSPIVELVSDFFKGKGPNKSINPGEVAAYRAAVRYAILTADTSKKAQDLLLLIGNSGIVMFVCKQLVRC